MNINEPSPHLQDETKITWLHDPLRSPYVRERIELLPLRARFPLSKWRHKSRKLIGYSEISVLAKAINGGFYRRIWYLMLPNDPYPTNSPGEAVKPSSIKRGATSEYGREELRQADPVLTSSAAPLHVH